MIAGWKPWTMRELTKVEVFEQIRRAHFGPEGMSIRELSRVFNIHRRTVRQALASPEPPRRKAAVREAPSLGPFKVTIDEWIELDASMPKKQRHTARRIFQRLVEELGADVSESSVRRYVAQVKRRTTMTPIEKVTISQTHLLGVEAEVDFGEFSFFLNGVLTKAWMFVMRLSASGKAFHFASFNQAQEVFLEGHVRAFEYFGGVPSRVRYDNLKTAVVRVLKGRSRVESERFVALRSHYLFDSFFCLPGVDGAHEKGGVEGEIGRFRRRHLVPVPHVANLRELNALIAAGDLLDDARRIDARAMSVAAHFELERPQLAPLPEEPFSAELLLTCRVDAKSRVCVRQNFYSVPVPFAGRRVNVRLAANEVLAYDGAQEIARHDRAPGRGVEVLELDHYLETLVAKPGALEGSSALQRARVEGRFTPLHEEFWRVARRRLGDSDGTRALIDVLLLERRVAPSLVHRALRSLLEVGSLDTELVAIEARRLLESTSDVIATPLARYDRPLPSTHPYDALLVRP